NDIDHAKLEINIRYIHLLLADAKLYARLIDRSSFQQGLADAHEQARTEKGIERIERVGRARPGVFEREVKRCAPICQVLTIRKVIDEASVGEFASGSLENRA